MKNPIDQLIESARDVRLTGDASARIRERLVAHMRANPINANQVPSPYQRFSNILSPFSSTLRMPAMALAFVLVITLGGATTYAAANALPGDALYPIKVRVIEPARGMLANSPEAKARFQVSLAESRAQEVVQLAVQDKLTPEEGARSQGRFDRSMEVARATVQELSRDNPEAAKKIEVSFTASLSTHERELSQIGMEASSTNANEAHSFARHLRAESIGASIVASTTVDTISPKKIRQTTKPERDRTHEILREETTSIKGETALTGTSTTVVATSTAQTQEESKTASTTGDTSTETHSDSGDSLKEGVQDAVHDVRNALGL